MRMSLRQVRKPHMKNRVVTMAIAGLFVEVGRATAVGEMFESAVVIEWRILPLFHVRLFDFQSFTKTRRLQGRFRRGFTNYELRLDQNLGDVLVTVLDLAQQRTRRDLA